MSPRTTLAGSEGSTYPPAMPSDPAPADTPADPTNAEDGRILGPEVRLGDLIFVPSTGEIRSETGETARLAPKPARLLAMMARSHPAVVGREEIRNELWPDVQVDFDQSLHFCIRQIRSALGDSAREPRFVENLPRRGYRLLVAPVREETPMARPDADSPIGIPDRPLRRRGWGAEHLVAALSLGLTALVLGLLFADRPRSKAPTPVTDQAPRLAIMSFRAPEATGLETSTIADLLLARFGHLGVEQLEVIGPSKTATYGTDLVAVARFLRDNEADFVVNGRFLPPDGTGRLLVEVIRASDDAHLYVRAFDDPEAIEAITDEVTRGLEEVLGVSSAPER